MSEEPKTSFISPNSYVPLTVVLSAIAITVIVMNKLNTIENTIAGTQSSLAVLEARAGDRWTATNMATWIDKTGRRNPTLNLPDVEEIKRPR